MRVLAFIFALGLLASCNEKLEVTSDNSGQDYYPIAIGQYRVYDVEEIIYKLSSFDTSFYQLRETIFDSLVSADQITYLIRRDKRNNAQEQWVSDSVWTAALTENFLAISENNVPFMKLTFPVEVGREWNGNSLNAKSEITYYYTAVSEQLIDSISLDDHIRLIIEDIPENVTGLDLRSEVYVRGVGLVKKDYFSQLICTGDNCDDDLGEVIGGRFLDQILIEAGNE